MCAVVLWHYTNTMLTIIWIHIFAYRFTIQIGIKHTFRIFFFVHTITKCRNISIDIENVTQTFPYLNVGMRILYIHKSYTKELLSAMTTSKLIIHFILKFALQLFWPYDKQPQTLVKSTFIFEDGQIGFASMKMTRKIWTDNLHFSSK